MGEMLDAGNMPQRMRDAINTLGIYYAERNMLYGALEYLMVMNNIPEIEVPFSDMIYFGKKYFVKFVPNEVKKIITATLMENEIDEKIEEEEQEENSEDIVDNGQTS